MSDVFIYGMHPIQVLLDTAPERLLQLMAYEGSHQKRLETLYLQAMGLGIRCQRVSRKLLDQYAGTDKHQGIVASVRAKPRLQEHSIEGLSREALGRDPFVLILDGVQDPHNLGACLRTADAAGVDAVIVPRHQSASLSPVVHKVACGAAETVPLIEVSNLARCLKQLKAQGIWLVGTRLEATQSLYSVDLKGPLALVLGAEGSGLRHLSAEHCDFLVQIPMYGAVASLNVSVATGICLYEALRQRQAHI